MKENTALIKPLVFGGIDGLTTTLSLVWGGIAAGENMVSSSALVVLGVANLMATGLSMGIGDYVGTLAEFEAQQRAAGDDVPYEPNTPLGGETKTLRTVRAAAMRSGFTMFFSFIFFGGIPLLCYAPYFGSLTLRRAVSTALCLISFFVLGIARSRLETREHRARSSIMKSSLKMMVIGSGAAFVSFLSSKGIYAALGVAEPTA